MDCSPEGSSVHGILQARILEWAAISSSRGSSWPRARTWISYNSCIGRKLLCLFTTSATWEACQNPGFLSKEICSVAPVDVLLFGCRSCKIDLFPRSLLCCYCLFLLETWLAGSQTYIRGKDIVPILGRVTQSCPSKTRGLPSPDLAQGHTRVMASFSGGLAICPESTHSPASGFHSI